jgi:hypothetical protein
MSGFHFGKLPFDCPSVNLEINSVNEGSFAAGSTININITDGTNPVTPESVTVVGNDVEVEVAKSLEILIPYAENDTEAEITIVTGSDGVITTADTTGLTSVVYEVNGSPETLPITLTVADVLKIEFDAAAADGVIKLSGTYA